MPGVSKEVAMSRIIQAPIGQSMLGMFESLTRGIEISRLDNGGAILMSSMREAGGGISVDRAVVLYAQGLVTNIRLVDLTRDAGGVQEMGLEDNVVFSFAVGGFNNEMRSVPVAFYQTAFDQAPFNGRVKQVDSGLYTVESQEVVAYRTSLEMFQRGFTERFGNTNKMRIID